MCCVCVCKYQQMSEALDSLKLESRVSGSVRLLDPVPGGREGVCSLGSDSGAPQTSSKEPVWGVPGLREGQE